jgi:peptidoglycan/xylan/chitin deacetylase (PgdA/CDA1 family)
MFKSLKMRKKHFSLFIPVIVISVLFIAGISIWLHPLDNKKLIPILLYHSVSDKPIGLHNLSISTLKFDQEMKYIADNGYTTIDLDDNGSKYYKPIIITLDDGYSDNYTNAYPILKKYKLKATIFLIAHDVGAPGYLTKAQILEMEDRVSFQSHTVSHQPLSRLNDKQVEYECAASKNMLTQITGKPVYALSYPSGRFNASVIDIASKYYDCAITTLDGFESQLKGNYRIRRMTVSPTYSAEDFAEILKSNGKV